MIAIRTFQEFDNLKRFVPSNSFVGQAEEVPGLINEFLPAPRNESKTIPEWQQKVVDPKLKPVPLEWFSKKLEVMPPKILYLHNIAF